MTETKCHCQAKLNFSVDQLRQLSLVEVKKNGTWKVNSIVTQKFQALVHTCLRCIIGVRWPDTMTNDELGPRTCTHCDETEMTVVRSQIKRGVQ